MKREDFLLVILVISIVCFFVRGTGVSEYSNEDMPDYGPVTINSKEDLRIPVNKPVPLSYKTQKEIYEIRKEAVQNSIFRNSKYKPSGAVFGQIFDGKPWMSMTYCCERGKPYPVDGPSEEARFIVNPSALVMLEAIFGIYCARRRYTKINACRYQLF